MLQEFWERLWDCPGIEATVVPVGPIYPESGEHVALASPLTC